MRSSVLNKQIQDFQFRIQQTVILHDEEINRLSDLLIMLKSEIIKGQQDLNSLVERIEHIYENRAYLSKKKVISRENTMARLKANHNKKIQELQTKMQEEISYVHQEFEKILEKYSNSGALRSRKEIQDVDSEISHAKETIALLHQSLGVSQGKIQSNSSEYSEKSESSEINVISDLQNTLQIRNNERLEYLKDSKKKLTECIQLMEDIDRRHYVAIQEKRGKIQKMESDYEETKKRLIDQRKFEKEEEESQMRSSKKRLEIYKKAIKKLEKDHHENIRESRIEVDKVRATSKASGNVDFEDLATKQELMILREELSMKQASLRTKEKNLVRLRLENDALHVDLGKTRHIIKYR